MIKKCIVCGKEFKAPPSAKKVTCSKACLKIRRSQINRGKKMSETAVERMSAWAKSQGFTDNLKKGTQAAMASPKSGRFDTNINAKDWILISPFGETYKCHSLINFIRKNPQLFDIDGSDEEVNRVAAGIRSIKGNMKHNRRGHSYHGWTLELPSETED